MKIRSIFLAIFFMGFGGLCADIVVHVERGVVNENQKDKLIDLIKNLKKHFDCGRNLNPSRAKKDWFELSINAKTLNLFVLTNAHTFICLSNKHKQTFNLKNIASIKFFNKSAAKSFDVIFRKVMDLTKIEKKSLRIKLDNEFGKEIVEKIKDFRTNDNQGDAENNNNNFSGENDDQAVDKKGEPIEDKPGMFAIRIDQKIAADAWEGHFNKKMQELVSLIYRITRTMVEKLSDLNSDCEKNNIVIITDQRTYAICLHATYYDDIQELVSSCTPVYSHIKVFTSSNEQTKTFQEILNALQERSIKWDSTFSTGSRDFLHELIEKKTKERLDAIESIASEHEKELSIDEDIRKMISEFHEVEPEHEEAEQKSWWNWVPWYGRDS